MKVHPIAKIQFLVALLMLVCGMAIIETTPSLRDFLVYCLCFLSALLGLITFYLGRIGLNQNIFIVTPMHKFSLKIAKFVSRRSQEEFENQYKTGNSIKSAGVSNQISGIIVIVVSFVFLFAYIKGIL